MDLFAFFSCKLLTAENQVTFTVSVIHANAWIDLEICLLESKFGGLCGTT
jgi:hypothetical protein